MSWKGDAKFNGKLTCGLKNEIRNLVNFHASIRKSESFHFHGLLLSKAYKVLDENAEELCPMTRKTDEKLEKKLALGSKNDRNLATFNANSGKFENLHFDVLLS